MQDVSASPFSRAFTLIELLVVIAIVGVWISSPDSRVNGPSFVSALSKGAFQVPLK